MGNRRLERQHCDENEYQDDFAEFLYEEEPSDNIDMVEQRAQPQINNEQSSPQTPLHINIASAKTPATKQVIQISSQSSPDIGMNSPRIAQMREPNQHAQIEERQYSMIRIIDSLNASGNCSGTRHNLYCLKRIVHPSKYKSSPYDNYTRHQTISAAELNHYNNILSIGETQQYKYHDCGIYAMKCMEWWNPRMHLKDMIRPEYIPNMRKQIANDLLFSEHNSQEEAKMLSRSFNPTKHGKYARQQ
uniref:Ubiquitin-like protease family profile domain-containing protein n=1 Tax=Oryza nivara TaxID=4536 RepID=A0A0E0IH22_ORYNI